MFINYYHVITHTHSWTHRQPKDRMPSAANHWLRPERNCKLLPSLIHDIKAYIPLHSFPFYIINTNTNNSAIADMTTQCCTMQFFAVKCRYLSLEHHFSVISEIIIINHTLAKSRFFRLQSSFNFQIFQI